MPKNTESVEYKDKKVTTSNSLNSDGYNLWNTRPKEKNTKTNWNWYGKTRGRIKKLNENSLQNIKYVEKNPMSDWYWYKKFKGRINKYDKCFFLED